MRQIIFRGKRIDNGEWEAGYFFKSLDREFLVQVVGDIYDDKGF